LYDQAQAPPRSQPVAKLIVGIATGEIAEKDPNEGKDPAAVKRDRAGGLKGGPARKEALPEKRRKEIAAAAARKEDNPT
jgi:hypothetical protein